MPVLVAIFGVAIKYLAAYAVARIFLALGLSYVVYQGMDTLMTNAQANITSQFGALGGSIYQIAAMCGVDVAITILFSAIAVKLLINGFSGGAKTALRFKGVSAG